MNQTLNELRQSYFKAILSINNEEELYSVLPSRYNDNYLVLMSGIIDLLNKEIDEYLALVKSENDSEILDAYFEELDELRSKVDVCSHVLTEGLNIEPEEEIDENQKVNIIFGVNPAGNVSFLNDLKRNVDSHYYLEVLELLDDIRSGKLVTNQEKVKMFNSNNTKLQGIMEQKGYQLRLLYRKLPNNVVYIMMIRVKKDTRVTKDFEEPIKRNSLLARDFENVKRRIMSKDNIEDLIIMGEQQYQDVVEFINSSLKLEGNDLGGK